MLQKFSYDLQASSFKLTDSGIQDQPGGLRLDDWLGAQSGGLSNLPSQDLHSNHSGYSAGLGRESLIEPSQALHHESARPALLNSSRASSELRPDVDQVSIVIWSRSGIHDRLAMPISLLQL